jgi:hypothetical protein
MCLFAQDLRDRDFCVCTTLEREISVFVRTRLARSRFLCLFARDLRERFLCLFAQDLPERFRISVSARDLRNRDFLVLHKTFERDFCLCKTCHISSKSNNTQDRSNGRSGTSTIYQSTLETTPARSTLCRRKVEDAIRILGFPEKKTLASR